MTTATPYVASCARCNARGEFATVEALADWTFMHRCWEAEGEDDE